MQVNFLQAQQFTDVALNHGIIHTMNSFDNMGHGVCFFDFDNDGWDDITLLRENDSIYFYKNYEGDFSYINSYVYSWGSTRGFLWVDYDNDYDNDFILSSYNGQFNLYQNDGAFNFTDVTLQSGLYNFNTENDGLSFGDYNNDGNLDLYVARYKMYDGDTAIQSHVNALYKNNGDGTFTYTSNIAGVADSIKPSFIGVWFDYDKDGFQDLYVINDRQASGNSLYKNNGDETFTNVSIQSGTFEAQASPMSNTIADFDNDSDLDIYMTNIGPSEEALLMVNNGNSTFTQLAQQFGVNNNEYAWGATWIDYDNNGFQDLYVTTGKLNTAQTPEVRNYFYKSNNAIVFEDSPQLFNGNHIAASYSVAKGDIDNDGNADLIVSNSKGYNSFLWQNDGGINNYAKVTLEGTISNRMAIGSWIHLYAGNQQLTHYTMCGEAFLAQNSQHHIFGLGQNQVIDSIVVKYLSGVIDKYYNLPVNIAYHFIEGETYHNQLLSIGNDLMFCEGDSVILDAGEYNAYLWNNGSNQRYLTVLNDGYYWADVTNQLGLIIPSDTIHVIVSNTPQINIYAHDISCNGASDGSINLDIINQTAVYSINWNNNLWGDSIHNLAAGLYNFHYVDTFNCELYDSIQINEPYPFNIQTQSTSYTDSCYGSFMCVINGGTPPYTIYFNGNISTSLIDSLLPGLYYIEIYDANNCSHTENFEIGDLSNVGLKTILNEIKIYPNPVINDIIYLTGYNTFSAIKIYNLQGQVLNFCFENNIIRLMDNYQGIIVLEFTTEFDESIKYKLMKE